MVQNTQIPHLVPPIDSELHLNPSFSMNSTPLMPEGFQAQHMHIPAVISSAVSAPSSEVGSLSTLESKTKTSKPGKKAKGKTKSETKTPRKRGRPKGKKTTSHPLLKRPKRPLSGYNLFFRDQREEFANTAANYSFKFAELAKTIGAQWKALDAQTRSIYEDRGTVEMIKYKLVMKEYNHKVKILNESATCKASNADSGSVSDLSSVQEDADSIRGQMNRQEEDETKILDARSEILGNNDVTHMPCVHKSDSTTHAEDAQSIAQVTTANVPTPSTQLLENLHPITASEDSRMSIDQELDRVFTNTAASEVTFDLKNDEIDFMFDLVEDDFWYEDNVPEEIFLVVN